jgi:spore coat polysaccharide biosynthesis protein SpsF (cytidylyltransferase family)
MKNINDVLVIVQARLNSERVPQKMIRPFHDTTLFEIAI